MADGDPHLQSLVDKRMLQRVTVEDSPAPGKVDSRARSRLFRDAAASSWGSLSSGLREVLFQCLPAACDLIAVLAVGLPRLMVVSQLVSGLQLAITVIGGAIGALLTAREMGLWSKRRRLSKWLRTLVFVGTVGGLVASPFYIAAMAVLALERRDAVAMAECRQASAWMANAHLLVLLPGLLLQACCAAVVDEQLWVCVLTGSLALASMAMKHDSVSQSYFSVKVTEDEPGDDLEDYIPVITGTLESFASGKGLLLIAFRMSEVVSSATRYALFHAGFLAWVELGSVAFGGLLLLVLELGAHAAANWATAGSTGDPLTLLTSCVFVPQPLLRANTDLKAPYSVKAGAQAAVLLPAVLAFSSARKTFFIFLLATALMWALFAYLSRAVETPQPVLGDAKELAERLLSGSAQVEALPRSSQYWQDPQLLGFCQAFASHYYGGKLEVAHGGACLDLTGKLLSSGSELSALHLVDPLLATISSYELNVDGAEVGDVGVEALGRHMPPRLLSLEANFGGTQVSDQGFAEFARHLPQTLVHLEAGLNSTRVGDQGISAFSAHLPGSLKTLSVILYNTKVGDRGLSVLASRLPRSLTSLRAGLFQTKVGDEGVQALVQGLPKGLTKLKAELSGTKVGDKGALALAEGVPPSVTMLEVSVDKTRVSAEGLAALNQATLAVMPKSPRAPEIGRAPPDKQWPALFSCV